MLRGEGIYKSFGGLMALNGVDFHLRKGEVLGMIGPNGSGKTTLFNVISGLYRPDRGAIYLEGRRIDGLRPYQITRLGIGRTFQIVRPLAHLTVLENVVVGVLYGRERISQMGRARVRAKELLEVTGLAEKRDQPAGRLPLADRKRLEIARALGTRPSVLLLDEVFAGLNRVEVEGAIQLMHRIRKEFGVAIFMIEHVMKAVMQACDRILALHHGQKIAEGSPREVAEHPDVIEAYLGSTHVDRI